MITFSDIPSPEKEMLVHLPYRVGLFVSESDDVGGEEADKRELQTLRTVLISYTEDCCKSEFVQHLMEHTVSQHSEWDQWGSNIHTLPEECEKAMTFLSDKLAPKELFAFKDNLMEVARSVALAYREFDDEVAFGKRWATYLSLWRQRLRAFLKGEAIVSQDEVLNISAREQKALDTIQEAFSSVFKQEPDVNIESA